MVTFGGEKDGHMTFMTLYIALCKKLNTRPSAEIAVRYPQTTLEFRSDRIKNVDWSPLLAALSRDRSLTVIKISSRQVPPKFLQEMRSAEDIKTLKRTPIIYTRYMSGLLMEALTKRLNLQGIVSLQLYKLPLSDETAHILSKGLAGNTSLVHLSLQHCPIGDEGCLAICKSLRDQHNVTTLELTDCSLTPTGAHHVSQLVKSQELARFEETWQHTLRYREMDPDKMSGLRRITMNENELIGDVGLMYIIDVVVDDMWLKAIDMQQCGISEIGLDAVLRMLEKNKNIVIFDVRNNKISNTERIQFLAEILLRNSGEDLESYEYTWTTKVTQRAGVAGSSYQETVSSNCSSYSSIMTCTDGRSVNGSISCSECQAIECINRKCISEAEETTSQKVDDGVSLKRCNTSICLKQPLEATVGKQTSSGIPICQKTGGQIMGVNTRSRSLESLRPNKKKYELPKDEKPPAKVEAPREQTETERITAELSSCARKLFSFPIGAPGKKESIMRPLKPTASVDSMVANVNNWSIRPRSFVDSIIMNKMRSINGTTHIGKKGDELRPIKPTVQVDFMVKQNLLRSVKKNNFLKPIPRAEKYFSPQTIKPKVLDDCKVKMKNKLCPMKPTAPVDTMVNGARPRSTAPKAPMKLMQVIENKLHVKIPVDSIENVTKLQAGKLMTSTKQGSTLHSSNTNGVSELRRCVSSILGPELGRRAASLKEHGNECHRGGRFPVAPPWPRVPPYMGQKSFLGESFRLS